MARSHAPEGFPAFSRHGSDVLVVWDPNDTQTYPYFTAAVYVGLALVARRQEGSDEADLTVLKEVETDLQNEIKRLQDMRKSADRVVNSGQDLQNHIRRMDRGLARALENSQEILTALATTSWDEERERESPIRFEDQVPGPALDDEDSTLVGPKSPTTMVSTGPTPRRNGQGTEVRGSAAPPTRV